MLVHAEKLYEATIHEKFDTEAFLEFLTTAKPSRRGIELVAEVLPVAREETAFDLLKFIEREITKIFFIPYEDVEPALEVATARAFLYNPLTPPERGIDDELLDATYRVATSRALRLDHRRRVLLSLIAQQLNSYEVKVRLQPYVRPIRSPYDKDVYPDLFTIEGFAQWRERV